MRAIWKREGEGEKEECRKESLKIASAQEKVKNRKEIRESLSVLHLESIKHQPGDGVTGREDVHSTRRLAFVLFLSLHPPILEPDLDLTFG